MGVNVGSVSKGEPLQAPLSSSWALSGSRRVALTLGTDALVVGVCFYMALLFRFLGVPTAQLLPYFQPLTLTILPIAALFAAVNLVARIDDNVWRYASVQEVLTIWATTTASTVIILALDLAAGAFRARPLPLSVVLLGGLFTYVAFVATRYRGRLISGAVWRLNALRGRFPPTQVRTLIYGAGEAGQLLARQLRSEYSAQAYVICGFIDDDPAKLGLRFQGAKVLGNRAAIADLVEREHVELIILAMPSVRSPDLREVIACCQRTTARIQVAPDVLGFITRMGSQPLLREVGVEDLLGRTPVQIDQTACAGVITGKVVLVTGACGSIGIELCRQLCAFAPRQLLVLDNNETGAYDLEIELRMRFPAVGVTPIVADVTDARKVEQVFRETSPQVVFHVAAYKHVPLMERYPEEAVRVNVGGTRAVAAMAQRFEAERFVLVSTDKAVNPSSVMGATKRVAEMLAVAAGQRPLPEHQEGWIDRRTLCTAVRFGNVLGSRGSVIPTFARQIELGGPVTVTHSDMTRYFMEISEAASLIIQAAALTTGGDIFILDMGEAIRVDDLARKMIRMRGLRPEVDISIVYTGIRPGEKLQEELAYAAEQREATIHPRINRHHTGQDYDAATVNAAVDGLLAMADPEHHTQLVSLLFDVARADLGRAPESWPAVGISETAATR